MLSFTVICVVIFIMAMAATAQERAVVTAVPSFSTADTQRIAALNNRGRLLRWTNRDSSIRLFQEAVRLSRKAGFLDGVGFSLSNMAVILMDSGRYEESLFWFRQALPYCLQAVYYKKLPSVLYNNMGNVYFAYGAYSNAAYYVTGQADLTQKIANKFPLSPRA